MTEHEEHTDAQTEPNADEQATTEGTASPSRASEPDPADDSGDVEPGVDRQARRDERWRERARTAEERADRLAAREVLRLLGQRVADAQVALSMSGETVADLLTDDGDVDDEAVVALADRMLQAHPALRQVGHHMDLGAKPGIRAPKGTSWNSLLDRGRRR